MKIITRKSIPTDGSYHGWPSICVNQAGEIMVVASGNRQGHVCPFGKVMLYRSPDQGRHWLPGEYLSNGPLDERDAGVCCAADGSVLVNYFSSICAFCCSDLRWQKQAAQVSLDTVNLELGFWMRRLKPQGRRWSEKYRIPANNPHGPTSCPDGSLLLAGKSLSASAAYLFEGNRLGVEMQLYRSCDQGRNWSLLGDIPAPDGQLAAKCFEPHGLLAGDGSIVVQYRNHNHNPIATWQTESPDMGKTWSRPRFVTPGYPPHLLLLRDGRILMSYGHRDLTRGIAMRISASHGKEWSEEFFLHNAGADPDMGYPASVQADDDSLYTVWYETRKNKKAEIIFCHWRFS